MILKAWSSGNICNEKSHKWSDDKIHSKGPGGEVESSCGNNMTNKDTRSQQKG